jgi:putative FmdB family regulatory protein
MAAYDYRCRTCDSTFEVHRSVTATADPAEVLCPSGHADATRVWSAVAVSSGSPFSSAFNFNPAAQAAPSGGGCCGGACGCG